MAENENNWNEWQKLVVERVNEIPQINRTLAAIKTEIAVLKVKAGIWGLVAGCIPPLVLLVIYTLRAVL